MDSGKRHVKTIGSRNSKIYMDLKDIIRENALPFLPAKSLFRFRSICRDWKLQISTPFFAHNQSISSRSVLGFFCQERDEPPSLIAIEQKSCGVPDPSLSFLPEPVEIKSSSNGLLLCQGKDANKSYYICNPVLKHWKKLPKPNANHGPQPAITLIFEPSILNFEVEYKVICAFASTDFDDATEFEIYSSKQKSWQVSGEICFANLKIDPKSGVYANGVVYWRGAKTLAYDLAMDRSQLLYAYSYSPYGNKGGVMGTLKGEVCTAYFNGPTLTVNVLGDVHSNTMEMGSKSKLWKDSIKIKMDQVLGEAAADFSVFAVSDNLVLVGNEQKMFSYDFEKEEHKALARGCNHHTSLLVPYVNSLASLEF